MSEEKCVIQKLSEFKQIIEKKLNPRQDLSLLQAYSNDSDNGTDDTSPTFSFWRRVYFV